MKTPSENVKQIKILHILWAGNKGGAEKNVSDIVTGLKDDFFVIDVLFLSKKGYWGNYLIDNGINVYSLNLKSAFSLKGLIIFIFFVLKHNYDFYHDHISAPFTNLLLKLLNKKVIYTFHNAPILFENMNFIKRKLLLSFADHYIVPSLFVKNYLANRQNIDSIHIYHGVKIFSEKLSHHNESDSFLIGTLTHLEKMKGNAILINSAKILIDKGIDNFKILIAGKGSEHGKLIEMISALSVEKYVSILSIENVIEFLNSLDIYVSTSLAESLGINIIEAMERGLPIVCTNTGPFPELVTEGENGYICQPEPEEIANRLAELIKNRDLRLKFGNISRSIAIKSFNINEMLENYKNFYLKCAE